MIYATLVGISLCRSFLGRVVTVNYDRSVEDGVLAEKYGGSDDKITSRNFPHNGAAPLI
jgi:hypothetical protein